MLRAELLEDGTEGVLALCGIGALPKQLEGLAAKGTDDVCAGGRRWAAENLHGKNAFQCL